MPDEAETPVPIGHLWRKEKYARRGWWVEFVIPFTFEGRLFPKGGVLVLLRDGTRIAMTREEFHVWA